MDNPLVIVAVVVAVGAMALLLRGFHRDETPRMPIADEGAETPDEAGDEAGPEDLPGEAPALTSDGLAFVPQRHGIKVMPARQEPEPWERSPARPGGAGGGGDHEDHEAAPHRSGPSYVLSAGDLVAARVKRGAPDVDPWRLEALGRDHEYLVWSFETEDAARAALGMLEGTVVRARRDQDGDPIPVGVEDWLAAERNLAETAEALAMSDDEEPEEPGTPR